MSSAEPAEERGMRNGHHFPRRVPSASGIYGLIVAGSVLAAGSDLPTVPLAVAVVVTLIVYWLAEEYAELVEHASNGQLPDRTRIRTALKARWPIVASSYIPVAALLLARLLGAVPSTAALVALIVVMVLLVLYGWRAAHLAGLRGVPLATMTLLAGGFGLLMIVLKFALGNFH